MITLYQGSGASGFQLLKIAFGDIEWDNIRHNAIHLLRKRDQNEAANILSSSNFKCYNATNHFGDEFTVLYSEITIDDYVRIETEISESEKDFFEDKYTDCRLPYRQIASAINKFDLYIRFIAFGIDKSSKTETVEKPILTITSNTVEQALMDADNLILSSGPPSAVDRVHTAFHGYLKEICKKEIISIPANSSVTDLFKILKNQHPKFQSSSPHNTHISKILKAFSSIIDTINTLRNNASIAHPNENLLSDDEAMLVINSTLTIMQYINKKIDNLTQD